MSLEKVCPDCGKELIPESYIVQEICDYTDKKLLQDIAKGKDIHFIASQSRDIMSDRFPYTRKMEYWIKCYECGWKRKLFDLDIEGFYAEVAQL